MNVVSRTIARVRAYLNRRRSDAEYRDELQFHIHMEAKSLRDAGAPPLDAAREARVRLGGVDRYTEELRDVRGGQRLDDIARDARLAFRAAVRSPSFTIVVALTLGVTIGATTALFSVVNAAMLRPLPFPRDHELVALTAQTPDASEPRFAVSHADFLDWRRQTRSFTDIALYGGTSLTITGDGIVAGDPERVTGVAVTRNFFDVLESTAALGRTFGPDDEDGAASTSVVISNGFWQRRFGGDSSIIGRSVPFTGRARTVIGVLGADFRVGDGVADAYIVLAPAGIPGIENHGQHLFSSFGRLKPGVTRAAAQADLRRVAATLAAQHSDIAGWSANVFGLRDEVVRTVRTPLLVLLAAAGFVVLIGCINVANLLLVRGATRGREVALRRALGASRARLVRQFLVEGSVLAALGGALGILLAVVLTPVIVRVVPPGLIPRLDQTSIDVRVLLFAAGLSLITALAVALWPALRATRAELAPALRDGGRGAAGSRRTMRARRMLVVAEVSLALMLLVCAGLVMESMRTLLRADPGFNPDNLVTMRVTLGQARHTDSVRIRVFRELAVQLAARPGITHVAASNTPPISEGFINTRIRRIGLGGPPDENLMSPLALVTPGYVEALGMRIVRGRDISWADSRGTMLVSESAAERLWPGEDAIGKRIAFGVRDQTGYEVVGIVGDVRLRGLVTDAPALAYLSYGEAISLLRTMSFVVRSTADEATALATMRSVVREIDPSLPVFDVANVETLVRNTIAQPWLNTALITAFAVLALVLAGIGIFGVVAFCVAERTQEFGVRVALGANAREVMRLVLREAVVLATAGATLGVALAFGVTPLVRRWIYGIGAIDAGTLGATLAALIVVATAACVVPARRALRVDPIRALRGE